ncbi:MAG: hypothetical protein EBS55_13405 [Flavobacteriaceae bacterium]|jgi:hypothetical protein|nr:hypothetical protein [Flavobacteriaceae bacterium]
MKYRIMVEEKNSGEMGYTPQVKFSWWRSWENILTDSQTRISTSDTARQIFLKQKDAEDAITFYKNELKEKVKEQIKKITYINL